MVSPRGGSCRESSARRKAHGANKEQQSKGLCTKQDKPIHKARPPQGNGKNTPTGQHVRTHHSAATTVGHVGHRATRPTTAQAEDRACRGEVAASPVHPWRSDRQTTHVVLWLSVPARAEAQVLTCWVEAEEKDHQQYAESRTQWAQRNLGSVSQEEQCWQVPEQGTRVAFFPTKHSLRYASISKKEERKNQDKYKSDGPRDASG